MFSLMSDPTQFVQSYFAFCAKSQRRPDIEKGGKIIMPPAALSMLTVFGFSTPMLFKMTNMSDRTRSTHVGVLEFVSTGRKIIVPNWMMRSLGLRNGTKVRLQMVKLPVATFGKFQPQSVKFLDITNAKAVLENALRHFACLTVGDLIVLKYNKRSYGLKVLETKPSEAVNIIECDMNVEFAQPLDYVEEQTEAVEETYYDVDNVEDADTFVPFSGEGNRLSGKRKKTDEGVSVPVKPAVIRQRGIPDYDHQIGFLRFWRPKEEQEVEASTSAEALPN